MKQCNLKIVKKLKKKILIIMLKRKTPKMKIKYLSNTLMIKTKIKIITKNNNINNNKF